MTTIERFYFTEEEIEVGAGGAAGEWHLMFVPENNDGMHIKISALSPKTFRALLDRINAAGEAILQARAVTSKAPASAPPDQER